MGAAAAAEILRVKQSSARNAGHVDAGMRVEALILRSDKGVGHQLRNRLNRQIEPAFVGVFGKQRAIGGVNPRHHRRLVILKLRIIRQVFGVMPQNACHRADHCEKDNGSGSEQEAEETDQKFHRRRPATMRTRAVARSA